MSTTTAPDRTAIVASPETATLRALAAAEAKRFARHPAFLFGATALIGISVMDFSTADRLGADPIADTVLPAFFLGIFGFVVGHRLTTSTRRTHELVDTVPVIQQRRTAALCLACLVPAAVGFLWVIGLLVVGAIWPPETLPPGGSLAWFGDESAVDIVAVLVATGPIAALGGSLLGVAVGRWAPFRGSAVLGMVALLTLGAFGNATGKTQPFSPYVQFPNDIEKHGVTVASDLWGYVVPAWNVVYTLSLCGLAVVAALLRDKENHRQLLTVGVVALVVAVCSSLLSIA